MLKWGVLQDVGEAGSDSEPAYVSFFHKLFQEFAVAWYICKAVEGATNKEVALKVTYMISFHLEI